MPAAHDNAYKHLFSHPQAVRALLRGFVHAPRRRSTISARFIR